MTAEIIMINEKFFSAPAGSTLKLLHNSRMNQVCDVCGKRRYCDWYEWDPSISGMTGMDVCPGCSKKLSVRKVE